MDAHALPVAEVSGRAGDDTSPPLAPGHGQPDEGAGGEPVPVVPPDHAELRWPSGVCGLDCGGMWLTRDLEEAPKLQYRCRGCDAWAPRTTTSRPPVPVVHRNERPGAVENGI